MNANTLYGLYIFTGGIYNVLYPGLINPAL